MRGFICCFKTLTGGRHCHSLGIRGVAHNGKERCGWYRSTNFLKAKYWLLKTATYTGTTQEHPDSRLEQTGTLEQQVTAGTAGYTTGQQDSWLDNRIRGWTTGYTAGQQDTWLDYRDTQPDSRIQTLRSNSNLAMAGKGARPTGAEPEPRRYSSSLLTATTGTEQNSCCLSSQEIYKGLV